MSLRLAVVLPTLNERGNLAPLIARLYAALGPVVGDDGWEVIVVDDDSADGTADEARRIAVTDSRVRVLQRIGRRGLAPRPEQTHQRLTGQLDGVLHRKYHQLPAATALQAIPTANGVDGRTSS